MENLSDAMEQAYVTEGKNQRELAELFGVPLSDVRQMVAQGQWANKRAAHRRKCGTACDRQMLREMRTLMDTAIQLCDTVNGIVRDSDQFHLHLVKKQEKTRSGDGAVREQQWVEQTRLDKVDIQALLDVTALLRELTKVVRDLRDLPTQAQRHAQDMEERKLALAREKTDGSAQSEQVTIALEEDVDGYSG